MNKVDYQPVKLCLSHSLFILIGKKVFCVTTVSRQFYLSLKPVIYILLFIINDLLWCPGPDSTAAWIKALRGFGE
jgi:hypothetical protein